MQLTLKLAIKAHDSGNSPFGAIITDQEGKILSKATNTTNTDINPLAHAEMNALIRLVKKMKQKSSRTWCCLVTYNRAQCALAHFIDQGFVISYMDAKKMRL